MNEQFDRSADDFADYLRFERQSSDHTVRSYARALAKWRSWCETSGADPMSPDDATTPRFIAAMREQDLASSTVQQTTAALRSWVRYRQSTGSAAASALRLPALPDKPRRLPQVLSDGEIDRLLESCSGESWMDVRDRTILQILADCGLRASEICSLTLASVDMDTRFLHVRGKGNKDRSVPFGASVADWLTKWLAVRADGHPTGGARSFLFASRTGDRLTRIDLWRLIRRRGERAGVAKARLHPHVLRHSVATRLLRRGMDLRTLQEFLGHSSIGTTEKYTHFDLELRDVYDRCHPHARLGGQTEDIS